MKSVLIGLPAFVGRHWLRVIIIGAALVLISRKQINFNVRLGGPAPIGLPGAGSSEDQFTAPAPEPAPGPAEKVVEQQVSPEEPSSFLSALFGGDDEPEVVADANADLRGRVAPREKGFLERFSLFGGGSGAPDLSAELELADEATVAAYIRRFSHVAQAEQDKYGIPASITLANGLLHTRAGTGASAQRWNNFFAVPCGGGWGGPCQSLSGKQLRAYETAWLSFRDHSKYITSGHFAPMTQFGPRDYQKWAAGLAELSFNRTDDLRNQLIGVIERYELHRFD